ncbi:MAG: hypothetical protein COT84_03685 [Chlamydiae bacterium CG10_big_fil_rev_8_21_14_0_10_35_9]|nr:MAG: hypothetical protein COT84_03685 [Chlamydiae bacterium CG10_big_fil_rev_8_21_14_0_10_35_9]
MDPIQIDLLSVFIAAIVYMLIGWLWYSPWFFGKTWLKLSHIKSDKNKMGLAFFLGFINAVFISFFLALLLGFLRVNTALDGFFVGFGVWLGFVVTTQFSSVIWAKQSFRLFLINIGCWFFSFIFMGGILGA